MREYIRYFKWVYILIAVLAAILLLIKGAHNFAAKAGYYERTNTECKTTQRVFDYGNVLTDSEERKLLGINVSLMYWQM